MNEKKLDVLFIVVWIYELINKCIKMFKLCFNVDLKNV